MEQISQDGLLTKIIQRADSHAEWHKGKKCLSPRKLRNIVSYALIHKNHRNGIKCAKHNERNQIIKKLEDAGHIQFIAVHTVVLNPLKIQK